MAMFVRGYSEPIQTNKRLLETGKLGKGYKYSSTFNGTSLISRFLSFFD